MDDRKYVVYYEWLNDAGDIREEEIDNHGQGYTYEQAYNMAKDLETYDMFVNITYVTVKPLSR